MDLKWFAAENKETWTLIYISNQTFELHDIFIGSFVAQRAIRNVKEQIIKVLQSRKDAMNQEQTYEFNSIVSCDAIQEKKSSEQFEEKLKDIMHIIKASDIGTKIQGIQEASKLFGNSYNYEDQLKVFASKGKLLLKELISNVSLRDIVEDELFSEFMNELKQFANQILFDT